MSVLIILVIASILVAGGFLFAFLWAVKSGQYEDTYSPSVRILFEERNDSDAQDRENIDKTKNTTQPQETKNVE